MGDFWKTTADQFNSLIDKPKMTEKLLSKPPFKYLFDIVAETTKKTGFANGLYSGGELQGDFYNDKEKKITYLEKLIKLVELMTGQQVKAKPQKIVAGLEPQLTNAFLQSIYKCATSGKSSDPYVAKVLGGGAVEEPQLPKKKQQPKQQQPKQQQAKPEQKKKVQRPPSARNTKKLQDQPKKVEEKQPEQQQEEPPQEVPTKPQKKGGQEYSKKVKELMEEGQQEAVAQKEAEVEEQNNKKNIKMGQLGKKKNQREQQKVISSAGDLSEKELDLVKTMIQSICQNTAPLGKSIQFINDDIESMNRELVYWRKQYNASKGKLQNQLKVTDEALMPIYDKLAEIEDLIKDQKGKIQTGKAQILKNDSIIRDLLMSVVTTK